MTDVPIGPHELRGTTATLSNISASASSGTALAANAARSSASFWNEGTTVCYLKHGTPASATSYTVQIAPGAFYELPFPPYTGQIDVIWAGSPSGTLRVTEQS